MCKLFALSDTSNIPNDTLKRILIFVRSQFSVSQKDGFGYAAVTTEGRLIERYTNPSDFTAPGALFTHIAKLGWLGEHVCHGGASIQGPEFDKAVFVGPLIAHGRTSTNEIQLRNTHPFTKNKWTLAHNGVVEYGGFRYPCESSCDSEHLLNLYVHERGVVDFAQSISGWFATLCIDPNNRLRVAKDAMTKLHVSWCETWKTYVFSTEEGDLQSMSHALAEGGFSRPMSLSPYEEIVFDGNECFELISFDPCRLAAASADKAKVALGSAVKVEDYVDPLEDELAEDGDKSLNIEDWLSEEELDRMSPEQVEEWYEERGIRSKETLAEMKD